MDIVSCTNCGVVLDVSKLPFPEIELEGGNIDTANATWTGDSWVAITPCPVCQDFITQN